MGVEFLKSGARFWELELDEGRAGVWLSHSERLRVALHVGPCPLRYASPLLYEKVGFRCEPSAPGHGPMQPARVPLISRPFRLIKKLRFHFARKQAQSFRLFRLLQKMHKRWSAMYVEICQTENFFVSALFPQGG
jgi:hypothetical protein